MVNISKLWNDEKFNSLTNNSKLLFIYLSNNPSINNVGVICQTPKLIKRVLKLSMVDLRCSIEELIKINYIHVKKVDKLIYFIIPKHFSTISKSDLAIEKIKSDLKRLPVNIQMFLDSIGINVKMKTNFFKKPTKEEVIKFSIENGHMIDVKEFLSFYENIGKERGFDDGVWVDTRGRIVRDWKMKMKKIWFKIENKIEIPKNTPEGLETFGVMIKEKFYLPDYWKDGKPFSKDFLINKELKKEYKKWLKNQ